MTGNAGGPNSERRAFFSALFGSAALLIVVLALTLLSSAPARADGAPTLSTDKPDYAPEQIVTIYGAGFIPDANVTVAVTRPDNSTNSWNVTSDATGAFVTTYQLDGIQGNYSVVASDWVNTATTTFTDADTTPPTFSVTFPSPNPNGWFVTSPVVGSITAHDEGQLDSKANAIACTDGAVGFSLSSDKKDATGSVTISTQGVHTFTCSATDKTGNTASAGPFTIRIDTTPPTLTLPSPIVAEATSSSGASVTYSASASDSVSGLSSLVCSRASGSTFPLGVTTVSCTASDVAGNAATQSFTVTVRDTTPPVLTVPPDRTVEATGPGGAVVKFSVSASDLVDGSVTPTCTPASGSTFPLGVTTVTCSATDAHGNTGSATFTIRVVDTTPPALTVPADIIAEATGSSGAAVPFSVGAVDIVDGPVSASCTPSSGFVFPLGTTRVACTATDAHANSVTATFTVTIRDTTAPRVTVPPSMTLEATGPGGARATFTATAMDIVDGPLPSPCSLPSGSTFPLGVTSVTCSATDAHGNTGSASFAITVQDTMPPALLVPGAFSVEATSSSGAAVTYSASATDLVDGARVPTCAPVSGSMFPLGPTTVNCFVSDAVGNTATGAFIVTVVDTTPPIVTVPSPFSVEATGPTGAVVTFSSSALDLVDGSVGVSCSPTSGSIFSLGTTGVTCTATDAAGNTGAANFEVSVVDTTPPTLSFPADITREATGPFGAIVSFAVSADDLVDGVVPVHCTSLSGSTFAIGTTSVSCSATDAAGNTASGSFHVIVRDTTQPALTIPADVIAEATGPSGTAVSFVASATDIVDGPVSVSCSPASGSMFPLGTTTVLCTATDSHGNLASGSFGVIVVDTTPPTMTSPSGMSLEATGASGATGTFVVTADDLVDGSLTPVCTPASGSTFGFGATTVVCRATDVHGNTGIASFTVHVVDTTPPALTVPADIIAEATRPGGAAVTFSVGATDIVDGPVFASCSPSSGSTFPLGTTRVDCTARDAHGNTGSSTFAVTVRDTTPPHITVPGDIVREATSASGASVSYVASASDLVDGPITPTCGPASGSTFPLGVTTVTCSATDAHGNTGSATFTIRVVDTTPPALTVPADIIAEATGSSGAAVPFPVGATDIVDGPVTATCSPSSGSLFAIGTTAVRCSATDAHGNVASATFTVTVRDTTAPLMTVPASMTLEATGPGGAVATFTASAMDTVDGALSASCSPPSGSTFPLGVTSVTCSATDAHGNLGSASFTITVRDTTPPALVLPGAFSVEATGPSGAAVTYSVSASDIVDGALAPTCAPASGSMFPLGTTTVHCSVSDAAGNAATGAFIVTVVDTTPPIVTVPSSISVEATGPTGAVVTFSSSASDIVDGFVTVSCSPTSGSIFPLGTRVVTCTATDLAGNTGAATFDVSVVDTTPPALSLSPDITREATGPFGAVVSFAVSADDLVDGAVSVHCTPVSGSTFAIGTTSVSCSATDVAGNAASASFHVIVRDTTPPELTLPADPIAEATGPRGAAVSFAPSATDIVDGPVSVSCSPASGSTFPLGTVAVLCTATDAHGNTATGSFPVTVRDTTPPTLVLPGAITAEATGPSGATVGFSASASDLVDGLLAAPCTPTSGSIFPLGTTTVVCTATDSHGNAASGSFDVIVVDTTPPTMTSPPGITLEATGATGAPGIFVVTAHDLVDGSLTPVCTPASGSTFGFGVTTVVCRATDAHGNTGIASFTIRVVDTTPPSLTVPAAIIAEATGPGGAAVPFSVGATDIVDGPVTATCSPSSGFMFPLGTTRVDCAATDSHGNTGSSTFAVTVRDTTPPHLTVPGDMVREATGASGASVSYVASASDLVDGSITPICAPSSGSTFPLGETTVTCSATDAHRNTGSATFKVRVVDTTPPVVTVPPNRMIEATGPSGATATFVSTATDLVDGSVGVSCAPASGSTFGFGTTTVTCVATDAHGNTGSASFTIKVIDTTPPSLAVPSDIVVEAVSPAGTAVSFTASATDIVDGSVPVTCTPVSGSTFPLGTTLVGCSAADSHGNVGTRSFHVTVRDTTAPVSTLTIGAPKFGTAPTYVRVTTTFTLGATDTASGVTAIRYRVYLTGSAPPAFGVYAGAFTIGSPGAYTVDYYAVDNAGNVEAPHTLNVVAGAVLVTYDGDVTGQYSDVILLKATFFDRASQSYISGKTITFALGSQTASAVTDGTGLAMTTLALNRGAGACTVSASFSGDASYLPRSTSQGFQVLKEDATVAYTGDTIVPTTSSTLNLRATVYESLDGSLGDLSRARIIFVVQTSDLTPSLVYTSPPIAVVPTTTPGIGVATVSISNLPENSYVVIVQFDPVNMYYAGPYSEPAVLTVYQPTGSFSTGGGWIVDSSGSHGNFGFVVRYAKSGNCQGHSVYVYRSNGYDYMYKSTAWIGFGISGGHAYFQGKGTIQQIDSATGLVVWSSGNYQFRVDTWDNTGTSNHNGIDTFQIVILDKNGVPYHMAGGQPPGSDGDLQGGNIVVHPTN